MKKKILAILMATLTVGSLLSGCGGAQSGDAAGKQESGKQESSDSEEPAEVVFAYMTQKQYPGVIRTGKNSEPESTIIQ